MKKTFVTVTDYRVANYLVDHECEMSWVVYVPEPGEVIPMLFSGKNVEKLLDTALSLDLPPLDDYHYERITSMATLLLCFKKQELEEEAQNG